MANEDLRSLLLGTAGLSLAALAAIVLTVTRERISSSRAEIGAVVRWAVVTIFLQSAHFSEELVSGFHQRFPELLGLTPWSRRFFISFNIFWLGAWVASLWGIAVRRRVALFALWFLGIASVANGLVHPLLSARIDGYFPGLFTSPLVGIAGVFLLRQLVVATRPG